MATKAISVLLGAVLLQGAAIAQTSQPAARPAAQKAPKSVTKYGANPSAGKTFTHDGVKLYYEVYGAGEPLLVVHGNGGYLRNPCFRIHASHVCVQVEQGLSTLRTPKSCAAVA